MNKKMADRYEYEVAQFKAQDREDQIREEIAKRVSENGGKTLNYFLMPKSYSRRSENSSKIESSGGDEFYVVPLVFGRLSLPRSHNKTSGGSQVRHKTIRVERLPPKDKDKTFNYARTTQTSPASFEKETFQAEMPSKTNTHKHESEKYENLKARYLS